jgi:hypothetical protein
LGGFSVYVFKAVPATRKQFKDLVAAIHVALRKRDGGSVVGEACREGGD